MVTTSTRITKPDDQSDLVGIGIVGCGYWGSNLIRNFADSSHCRVISACDTAAVPLAAIGARHTSVRLTLDFDDLLTDPEIGAVVIATPVQSHATLAQRALESGKHVLIEKPMTASTAEAERLIETADQRGLTLMVDHTFIYTGAVQLIKRLMDAGDLGTLYYYDSVRINLGLVQDDVSVIWDLAAHDLATMDYLIPQKPRAISVMAAAHLPGQRADVAYLTALFDGELIAHFHVNWLSPVKVRQVLIGGDRRMILYDDIEPTEKVKVYDRGVHWNGVSDQSRRETLVAYRMGDMHAPVLDQKEALSKECVHFLECVRTGATPLTDGLAGLRVVRWLEAAERSAMNEGRVESLD
jgi:predicted dehydrogenase